MTRPRLAVIEGGAIACSRPSWQCDEAAVELTVSKAERLVAATHMRRQAQSIRFWLRHARPDEAMRNADTLVRLAAQEETRARSASICADGVLEPGHGVAS